MTRKSATLVKKLIPITVQRPKVVITANTPAMKLDAPGSGDLRLIRLAKMTAETTPALSTFNESSNANPASAGTRAPMRPAYDASPAAVTLPPG